MPIERVLCNGRSFLISAAESSMSKVHILLFGLDGVLHAIAIVVGGLARGVCR